MIHIPDRTLPPVSRDANDGGKPVIYMHIGMQKTGSTALEVAFCQNRDRLLREGVSYPETPGRQAHHGLVWALQGNRHIEDHDGEIATYRARLAKDAARAIVLSSENFCDLDEPQISRLAEIIPAHRAVQIVCYVRHPVDWVESQLNHKIKSSRARPSAKLIERYTARTDYFSMIERWGDRFGSENVTVRIYQPGADTVADFLQVIGLPDLPVERAGSPVNVSLSDPLLKLKIVANAHGHSRGLRDMLEAIQLRTRMKPRSVLLSPEDRARIRAVAQPSNELLWAKYVHDGARPFNMESKQPGPADAAELSAASLLQVMGHVVALQQQRIEHLERQMRRRSRKRMFGWPWFR